MKLFRVALSLLAACSLALPIAVAEGQAAIPDVSGAWTLDLSASLPDDEVPCVFTGSAVITQSGDQVTGPADLTLASGPAACPGEMTGTLTGTVFLGQLGEPTVNGVIEGALGEAAVEGTFTTAMVAAAGLLAAALPMQEPTSGGGSMSVTTGPFAGTGGTWSAAAAAPVPTLAPLALTALVLLLLAAGFFVLRRQELHRAA